jgi:ubiquitin-conjugating enzyme E2 Q
LQFKVGLTRKYKPGKEHALEVKRTYGLVDEEPQGWSAEEALPTIDADGFPVEEIPQEDEEEDDDDEGRFDSFSLSSSLESLLDHSLVRVIQMRVKYGLGWAGAETLVAETERLQQTADDILAISRKVRTFRSWLCLIYTNLSVRLSIMRIKQNVNSRKVTTSLPIPSRAVKIWMI